MNIEKCWCHVRMLRKLSESCWEVVFSIVDEIIFETMLIAKIVPANPCITSTMLTTTKTFLTQTQHPISVKYTLRQQA